MDFKQSYNRQDFLNFLQGSLLPDDFIIKEESFQPSRKLSKIKKVVKLGEVPSLGSTESYPLNVYEVEHDSEYDPRITLTKEAFSIMRDVLNDRALIIFKTSKSENYRLSLMKIEIKGKGKRVEKDFSNPRRFSFYLGPDAKVNTPTKFLIKNEERIKDFDDLMERFSLEPVNKEFFNHISNYFNQLVGGKYKQKNKEQKYKRLLKLPSVSDDANQVYQEFAVRLIGRIIFVWFLKYKKSKNNLSLIPEELVSLKAVKKYSSYYHEVLEKLFFNVLNTPIEQRKKDILKDNEKIPFLNGGLFDPHDDDFYDSKPLYNLVVPDEWFEEFFGVLEQYNFTIDENTSADVELSVDPEMLGRIFENLLAEINPETGETARKETGSYYTRRPIVEHMVDGCIKRYLVNKTSVSEDMISELLSYGSDELNLTTKQEDEIIAALDELKVIDPACGSGAFPMGILQKSLLILQKVDPQSKKWFQKQLEQIENDFYRKEMEKKLKNENWDYVHKLGIIQNSIYGVDIQPIAVEISKLRFFLSLVVDEKVDDDNPDNRGIKPLPNLEFKFVCANSLLGLPNSITSKQSGLFEEDDEIELLKKIRDKYFVSAGQEKELIKFEFTKVQKKMFENQLDKGFKGELTRALAGWDPFTTKKANWFDPEWMFGIKNFHIVIGNPPYGFRDVLTVEDKKYFRKVEKINFSSGDSAELFSRKCFDLLISENGILSFIIPKKSAYGDSWDNYRKEYWLKYNLLFLLDSGKAFENVLLEQMAFGLQKNNQSVEVELSLLNNRKNCITEVGESKKEGIFMQNNTVQIYKILFSEIYTKIIGNSYQDISVKGDLGLGIGTNFYSEEKTEYKLLKGIDIQRWNIRSNRYLKNKDKLNWDKASLFLKPKVIAQRLVAHIENPIPHLKITACYDKEGIIITNTLTSFILPEKVSSFFWLGYLNSNLLSWYAYNFIYSRAIRSMDFYTFYIEQIPIPKFDGKNKEIKEKIEKVVEKIVKETGDKDERIINYEKELNELVYKLFDLEKKDIDIIENFQI